MIHSSQTTPPLLESVLGDIRGLAFLYDPVAELRAHEGSTYDAHAEGHLSRLNRYLGQRGLQMSDAVEAFVEMTLDVMKMQETYYETGEFALDLHGADLYSDEELMGRRYLLGLFLAQVLWPHHYNKLRFFEREMFASIPDGAKVLDVGCGPGSYGLAIGRAVSCEELLMLDISPLSERLVSGLVAVDPPRQPSTFRFVVGDFLDDALVAGPYDAIVFSEIVEHLEDPAHGMERLGELLGEDGVAFFSTATNAAFYDHTIVFSDLAEIEGLLRRHGFEIISRQEIVAMAGPAGEDRDVVDFNAVIKRARRSAD